MIRLTSLNNKKHLFFQNYHELCEHINRMEKFKSLTSEKTGWRFRRRSHEALSFFYSRCPKTFEKVCTPQEKAALERGLGLIEILKGDENSVTQILYTSGLDLIPLKKDWCLEYCLLHGYTAFECEGMSNIKKKK